MMMEKRHLLLLIFALFHTFPSAPSQSFIGVNYGQVADNLPPPSVTAALLQSTTISKLRLYGADPAVIQSFAGTNISLVIGVSNADVGSLASDPNAAASWVSANVFPYVNASSISIVSVWNAKAFVTNLVAHLRTLSGTPLMPGRSVDTYLFALYDEDLKPGPTSERSFGLYRADQTMNYDAGLAKSSSTSNATASPPQMQSNTTSDPTLQSPPAPPVGMTTGLTQPVGWCGPGATLESAAAGGSLQPAVQCFSAVGSLAAVRLGHLFSCVALTLLMLTP